MSEINEINIPNVVIPKFGTNEVWLNDVPFIPSNHPSVTTQIGFPIVEIPGCVKMHKDNQDKVTRMPFDYDLVNQDEDGVTTLCPHGEYPTYDAMDYQPEQLIITRETPPPEVAPPPTPPEFEADAIPDTKPEDIACPGPGQIIFSSSVFGIASGSNSGGVGGGATGGGSVSCVISNCSGV